MPSDGKKGITVKIDAELHAEVRQYLESHSMTMAEFITLALQDELHPKITMKEDKSMEKMRTLAFQVPESLFQKIKDYLQRNNISQKEFMLGLIENELQREQVQCESAAVSDFETVSEEAEEYAEEQDESALSGDFGDENAECDESEDESEDENMGFSMVM